MTWSEESDCEFRRILKFRIQIRGFALDSDPDLLGNRIRTLWKKSWSRYEGSSPGSYSIIDRDLVPDPDLKESEEPNHRDSDSDPDPQHMQVTEEKSF